MRTAVLFIDVVATLPVFAVAFAARAIFVSVRSGWAAYDDLLRSARK